MSYIANEPRKPKNARSKRALAKQEPRVQENAKSILFLKGTNSSSLLNSLLTDLYSLKRHHAIRFTKKNPIHPFEDASSLEFFSHKNDASLLVFGSHSKKRPHSMTWVRCFGGHVLDMLEVYVVQETARTLQQFKGEKCKVGVKPLLSFSGTQFESPVSNKYTLAKSLFVDFFRGAETQPVDVEGLQLLISFFAGEEGENGQPARIQMRCWRIITKKSGQKVPRVEVEEMGPRIDFQVGRMREADAGVLKEALKSSNASEVSCAISQHLRRYTKHHVQAKRKKNVETDVVGDKIGRIHLGKQDLSGLQTRKMKGLKRGRDTEAEGDGGEEDEDMISEDEDDVENGVELKRPRLA